MDGEKTFYITPEKLQELQQEHDKLVVVEHEKATTDEAPRIFESDNINPEFVSFQEDMGFLRNRIDELKHILEHHEIIKPPAKDKQQVVGIGALVSVHVNGQPAEFTITGTLEANPVAGKISNESPVGKALLGRAIGDQVVIDSPTRSQYKIKSITYQVS